MSQITFYLLPPQHANVEHTACRLTAKAWRNGYIVHLLTSDLEASQQLDTLLWRWQEDSFLPHCIVSPDETSNSTPITISHTLPEKQQSNFILINLTAQTIQDVKLYKRICEIVAQDEEGKVLSREKFRSYRQAGIQPATYQL